MTAGRTTIDDLVAEARMGLQRPGPADAAAAHERGAVLVDIRSAEQREQGVIPGAAWVPRNVLEWRLDPDSGATDPRFGDLEAELIVFCAEGYASSLAVATLRRLGFARATDMDGGFEAWAAAGLPVDPP